MALPTFDLKLIFGAQPITDDMRQMLDDLREIAPLPVEVRTIRFLDPIPLRFWIEWEEARPVWAKRMGVEPGL